MYDSETGLYYLGSRYYDPGVGRFINADAYLSTGQDVMGYNMFVYCDNNPVNRLDPTGRFLGAVFFLVVGVVCAGSLSGCSSNGTLASAPDLDITTAPAKTYNCYGNAIKKQILANPSGYEPGDSSRKTYNAVVNDLGKNNVRELGSINDPIEDDEYKVALRCGPDDYHFIRQDDNGWFNKSGTKPGLFIEQSSVEKEIWHPIWVEYGRVMTTNSIYYDDETIYFAVKVRWDEQ